MTKEPCLQMPKSRAHVRGEHLLNKELRSSGHMRELGPTKQPLQNICQALDIMLSVLHPPSPLIFPTSLRGRCYYLYFPDKVPELRKAK